MTLRARTMRRLFCVSCVAALATVATAQAQTQDTPPAHDRMAMKTKCQTMMASMKTAEARLDELVARMNSATGQQKVEQIAAVLTEMVAQRKAMHGSMACMNDAAVPANPPKEKPEAGHEQHH